METTSDPATGSDQAGFQVDDLTIDLGRQRVTRSGAEIALPPLSFELLLTLARAAPNLVTFDQLTERVWPGLVISPETISQRVKLVRTALGDDPHAPRYIGGVRGRGYRMVAAVRPLTERRRVPESVTPEWLRQATAAEPAPAPAAPPPPAPPPAEDSARTAPGPVGWLGTVLIVLLLLAVPWGATHLWRRAPPASAATVLVQPPHTIAVLPLVDVTPGDGNSYLGDGLAQELSARLARIHGLRVASRTSAFAFRGRETDVRTIGQALGVRHVLEGSVMRTGNQLRVTAQLVDAASGFNVWSQTYNRTWEDLVAIQDDVARSIVSTLKVVLAGELDPHPPTTRVDAFDLYLAGIAQLHAPGHAGLEQAGDSFRRALALDPKFALAHAGLCERYTIGYESTREAALIPQAEGACDAALKLDPSLREVSAALAHLYVVSGRSAQAVALYREAIRADPDNADGYMGLGEALEGERQAAEAESAYRRAVDAEPTYPGAQTALGTFLLRHGRAAAAVPFYRRATELIPASPAAYNNLGAALEMTADFAGAAAAFERSLALEPTRSAYSNLGTVYYFLGRYPDAVRMFAHATELASEDHRVWGNLADARWQIGADRGAAQHDYRHAIALAQRSLEVNPRDGIGWMQLAYYSARAGDAQAVPGYASRALELDAEDELVHYYAALIALERGDADAALASLRRAVELGYPPQLVRAAPDFATLRADARFRQLVEGTEHSPPA